MRTEPPLLEGFVRVGGEGLDVVGLQLPEKGPVELRVDVSVHSLARRVAETARSDHRNAAILGLERFSQDAAQLVAALLRRHRIRHAVDDQRHDRQFASRIEEAQRNHDAVIELQFAGVVEFNALAIAGIQQLLRQFRVAAGVSLRDLHPGFDRPEIRIRLPDRERRHAVEKKIREVLAADDQDRFRFGFPQSFSQALVAGVEAFLLFLWRRIGPGANPGRMADRTGENHGHGISLAPGWPSGNPAPRLRE